MEETNNQVIYVVKAFYDMNIDMDEQILYEVYATERLAQERCKKLIKSFKEEMNDGQSYVDCWDESEFSLYAYMDSEWNVNIFYEIDIVRDKIEEQ